MSRTHLTFGRPLSGHLTPERVAELLREARAAREAVAAVPIEDVLGILERVGQRFVPGGPLHGSLLEVLPGEIGFSREMVALELTGLHLALTRPFLEGKLRAEWGRADAVDTWHRRAGCPLLQRAVPRGVVLHVASGNVSTTGVLSVVEGLLARNVNLLKAASAATTLPLRFAETLRDCDPEGLLRSALAVLSWSGEREALHPQFLQEVDAVVVWGGDEVVATYRQSLGPQARLIAYGPKVSMALLGADTLQGDGLQQAAAEAARDVALWDQNACSSAQAIYLEDPEGALTPRFVAALSEALDRLADELPMGTLDLHEKAEITKERELAIARELLGGPRLVVPTRPGRTQSWTMLVDPSPEFELSPLYRTVAIKPVQDLALAIPQLARWRAYLQTVGLRVAPARLGPLAQALLAAGVHRVTRTGEMSGGAPGEPHDGVYGLGELVRWISLDLPERTQFPDGHFLVTRTQAERTSWARRRRLVESILPDSPYWRDRLPGVPLKDETDWLALPQLRKADLVAHTPPAGDALLTCAPAPEGGGHWLRTGGSSGDPKLSIYGYDDYEADMARAARGAWMAGLRPGQKVANLFFAGDLYGSFLSLNRVLELVGANSFPLTHFAPIESVLTCLRQFQIDTVMGLSTYVQAVLAEVAKAPEGITIRQVYYAGEPFHASERQRLRETLGITRIASIGYGGVDAGPMGYACSHCTGNVHHVHDDHVYLEILDPQTGQPCPAGKVGEVLITSLNRRVMPLLRYHVGDLARWLPEPCACGAQAPRFELTGRVEDLVSVADARLNYGEIQAVVAEHGAFSASPQLILADDPRVTVRVESLAPRPAEDPVIGALKSSLEARVPGLAPLNWSLEIVPAGGLERVGRTGKVIRVIDRRQPS
ncbi:MAG: acyl-CoA reductase [Candidatus Sericytochromatia bacterium]|nr:acyl-CoA reductase [Candidatus Sericytochromatia bacterium]